jgi:hypothetical protein
MSGLQVGRETEWVTGGTAVVSEGHTEQLAGWLVATQLSRRREGERGALGRADSECALTGAGQARAIEQTEPRQFCGVDDETGATGESRAEPAESPVVGRTWALAGTEALVDGLASAVVSVGVLGRIANDPLYGVCRPAQRLQYSGKFVGGVIRVGRVIPGEDSRAGSDAQRARGVPALDAGDTPLVGLGRVVGPDALGIAGCDGFEDAVASRCLPRLEVLDVRVGSCRPIWVSPTDDLEECRRRRGTERLDECREWVGVILRAGSGCTVVLVVGGVGGATAESLGRREAGLPVACALGLTDVGDTGDSGSRVGDRMVSRRCLCDRVRTSTTTG